MASSDTNPWAAMAGVQPSKAAPTTYPSMSASTPALIQSMIRTESNGNPNAVSSAGAQGLMQLEPATARAFGAQDPMNPEQNVKAGTAYVNHLLAQFHGDPRLAMAAYNAGPTRVAELQAQYGPNYDDIMPHLPPETQAYVPKVLGGLNSSAPAPEGAVPGTAAQPPPSAPPIGGNPWAAMAGVPAQAQTPTSPTPAPAGSPRTYPSDAISKTPLQVPTLHGLGADNWYTNALLGLGQGAADLGQDLAQGVHDVGSGLESAIVNPLLGRSPLAPLPQGTDLVGDALHRVGLGPNQNAAEQQAYNNITRGSIAAPIGRFASNSALTMPVAGAGAEALGALPGVAAVAKGLVNTDPVTGALTSRFLGGLPLYRGAEGVAQGAILGGLAGSRTGNVGKEAGEDALMGGPLGTVAGAVGPLVGRALTPVGDALGEQLGRGSDLINELFGQETDNPRIWHPATPAPEADAAAAVPEGSALGQLHKLPVLGGVDALNEVLDRYRINPDNLSPDHLAQLRQISANLVKAGNPGVSPDLIGRTANLQQWGMQPTLASVTRNPEDWAQEDFLRATPEGGPLQQRYLANNFNAVKQLNALHDVVAAGGTGAPLRPDEVGQQVMDAVDNGWENAQTEVGKKYDMLRNVYGDEPGAYPNHLLEKLDEFKGVNNWDELGRAVRNRMSKWGYLDSEGLPTVDEAGNPTPMTVGQTVELRKFLGQLPKVSPTAKYGVRQLIGALDDDFNETASPAANSAVQEATGAARQRFQTYRDGGLMQSVVDGKASPDTIMKSILGRGRGAASREALQNLREELLKTPEGQEAWANVRGKAAEALTSAARGDLPSSAVAAPGTVRNVTPVSFRNELARQEPKADLLYGKSIWDQYKSLSQALDDTFTPPPGDIRNMSRTAAGNVRANNILRQNALNFLGGHPLLAAGGLVHEGIRGFRAAEEVNNLLNPEKVNLGSKAWEDLKNNLGWRSLPITVAAERNANTQPKNQLLPSGGTP